MYIYIFVCVCVHGLYMCLRRVVLGARGHRRKSLSSPETNPLIKCILALRLYGLLLNLKTRAQAGAGYTEMLVLNEYGVVLWQSRPTCPFALLQGGVR